MIAVLTDPEVGGTFLTWTLYYLSGRSDYFSIRHNKIIPLPLSPLTNKNAHGFLPNQPRTLNELSIFLTEIVKRDEYLYAHNFKTGTEDAVDQICKLASKVVVLSCFSNQSLYHCSYQRRTNALSSFVDNKKLTDADSIFEDFVLYFFKNPNQKWKDQGLTNIWDKREFVALNFDLFDDKGIYDYITSPHFQINTNDLWLCFESRVRELFNYLDLKIDESRYEAWLPVYSQWKKQHTSRLRFGWYFDMIIKNILNGIDFDLQCFDLDIIQEAAIQQALIYKHNLNFKTWQLTKFNNTKQLHELLEPNIHDLTQSRCAMHIY